ncbi:MAG: hypothetical protein WD294_12690 [Phycisphaeraceae bacterium]
MADSSLLLRMLEPAVRPVSAPEGRGASSAAVPIEERSFESLLGEAISTESADVDDPSVSTGSDAPGASNLLGPLSQVGAIENASLRTLIERGG